MLYIHTRYIICNTNTINDRSLVFVAHDGNDHMNTCNMREFVQTHAILAPGASELGLGAAALAPLRGDTALAVLSYARSLFVRRLRT